MQYEENFLQKLSAKCQENDNSSCIIKKVLDYMNKMIKKPSFSVNKRITLLQTRSVCGYFHRSFNKFSTVFFRNWRMKEKWKSVNSWSHKVVST